MTNETDALPGMDDSLDSGPTEQELLDAVMSNSPFMEGNDVPLPEEEEIVQDSADEVEEEVDDPDTTEEVVSDEETEEEVEEAEGEDDTSTQEPEVFTADDLDLDAKVRVKVDGEELDVSFADLLKGYQVDASLSKKGRELGEARKQLEEERETMLGEVQQLGQASAAMMMGREQNLSKKYHEIEAQIEKARKEEDTFTVNELKDKREQVQKNYWKARKQREELQEGLAKQQQQLEEEKWQKQIEYFSQHIEEYVPGFDDKVAADISEFAIGKGISQEVLSQITDPAIIKFINDFRILDQGVKKGEARRKTIPAKKAVPVKKQKTTAQKKASKENMVKARAFREDASSEDQMDFLRQYAAKSLSN